LFEWFNVLREYRGDRQVNVEDDVAYWYNERATLSTLAGALWRSRCLVLEEYQTLRQGNGSKAGPGRADLWCKIAGVEYTVEAKQHLTLSYPAAPGSLKRWAEKQLDMAATQCLTDSYGGPNRLAMVFMVPSLLRAPTDESLAAWIDTAGKVDAEIKAWYLDATGPQSPKHRRYFPGVILFARIVSAT
jgi:hypothetical protein